MDGGNFWMLLWLREERGRGGEGEREEGVVCPVSWEPGNSI